MEFLLLRTAFFSLSAFTFLNSVKILKIPLHFPWLVLFVVSFGIWIFWEKIYKKRFYFPRLMGSFFAFHLSADILGNAFKLYGKFIWYDNFTHFTGGATFGVLTILVLSYLNKKNQWKLTLTPLIFFAISLALSLGILYEFWEYFVETVLGYHVVYGVEDLIDDLLLDLIGAITLIIPLAFLLKKRAMIPQTQ